MNGDSRERAMSSKSGNTYTAVLFYASWCPFSQDALSTFEVLGSLYPEIDHLAVEQSSTMPSLFSRYGIHSLPAIIILSQKSRTRFRGSKDLDSLVKFYKKTTEHEPVQYIAVDQSGNSGSGGKSIVLSRCGSSAKETLTREPYLFFCVIPFFTSDGVRVPKIPFSFKKSLGIFPPPSEFGNFWRDKRNLRADLSDD